MGYALALLSGGLLALSFPRFGHPAIAWVALTPLLLSIWRGVDRPGRRPLGMFARGLACGAIYFAGTIYWTGGVMARYGGLSLPLAAAIAALLVAYLALFPAAFACVLDRLLVRYGRRGLWLAPAAWTATEYGRLAIFGGFPWVLLGYSQVTVLPVAQLAAVTGVFGLSFLIATVSTALAWTAVASGRERWVPLVAVLSGVALLAAAGQARLRTNRLVTEGRPLRVGIVQGNVPQDEKWQAALGAEIFERYLRLTRTTIEGGARFVLWPESATPFYFGAPGPETEVLRTLARTTQTALLIGSDQGEAGADGTPPRVYNAAFLLKADGTVGGVYRKVHLVPFGEYVPLKSVLFFAAPLVEAVSDFSPGARVTALPLDGGRVSTAICYEVVYPALIREGVLDGSELLTTITNDAWFGRSSAPWQHFNMAAMRAIEQGRYLVRSANTGVSGVVDPYGRVLLASDLFVEGAWVADVRLLDGRTIYARTGDLVVWISIAVIVIAFVAHRGRAGPAGGV
ncbi:MAG TPA: apolipoprotein N-acyltransferase [Chloroflexota bacterium]|nr:apolipoprotein N-acyltransferase [Chloroflexota bacterium]